MAQIIPFRGYRYDTAKVGEISDVVTPPYDRIYPDVQASCYERHPYNIVRIVKGRQEPSDDERENPYTRAAALLREWIETGVLVRDELPSLYVYHQEYTFAGDRLTRKGVIALGKLEPEKVHGHEKTLRGPREDRLRLMRATEANFGHIFMLYRDSTCSADRVLAEAIRDTPPVIEARDAEGNAHRVWRVTDEGVIRQVQAALADKELYIADGHHRYETAVNFMRESEAKGWRPASPESFDARMMTLFNVAEPGMSIRPIHRLIHGVDGFEAEAFFAQTAEQFAVTRHPSFEAMIKATHAGSGRHTFGCCAGEIHATLQLKNAEVMDSVISEERSADYRRLDVSILHGAILDRLLGINARALEEQQNVTYTVDPRRGAAAVDSGDEQILFLLNATSAEEVIRVADHGEKMPQKSTDFYPKLLTGLVLTTMDIRK